MAFLRGAWHGKIRGQFLGCLTMLGLAYLFSTDRRAIRLKTMLGGVGLQLAFAFFVLRFANRPA